MKNDLNEISCLKNSRSIFMNAEIYYFSGTGNSFAVARDIAGKINGKLISIPSVMKEDKIKTNAEVIGIVFPTYYIVNTGLPLIIEKFAGKLSDISSKYIFALATCGGGSGDAFRNLDKIIKSRGGKLSGGFALVMPSNVATSPKEKHQKIFNDLHKKFEFVLEYIISRKEGKIESTPLWARMIFTPLVPVIRPIILGALKKLSNSKNLPFEELVYLSDKSYHVDANCDGCGICEKICPVKNIRMKNGKPEWLHHCETCLACFHWCPKESIQGGLAPKLIRYHHPDVKITDMIKQAE